MKQTYIKQTLLAAAIAAIGLPVYAELPIGGRVSRGTATISTSGNTMTINQSSDILATNWQSFNIGAGNTVRFQQPSATSIALARVTGTTASTINGNMNANGQVFLVNPNGILFGQTAQVNVGGLVATTHAIADSAITNSGDMVFETSIDWIRKGVENYGVINATGSSNSSVVLAGIPSININWFIDPGVGNYGTINATGNISLESEKLFRLNFNSSGLMETLKRNSLLDFSVSQGIYNYGYMTAGKIIKTTSGDMRNIGVLQATDIIIETPITVLHPAGTAFSNNGVMKATNKLMIDASGLFNEGIMFSNNKTDLNFRVGLGNGNPNAVIDSGGSVVINSESTDQNGVLINYGRIGENARTTRIRGYGTLINGSNVHTGIIGSRYGKTMIDGVRFLNAPTAQGRVLNWTIEHSLDGGAGHSTGLGAQGAPTESM